MLGFSPGTPASSPKKLLIIYETEAKQWATFLQSVFTGQIPADEICCYDIAMASSRKDDFSRLSRYACKLLILSKGMLEGLHQMRRFFLSRVLSPAACVVVLLCGVDSLTPLLDRVPINSDECLQISSEQDPPEYVGSVIKIIKKGSYNPSSHRTLLYCLVWQSSSEVFILLKNNSAGSECEVEFKAERQIVRVKPARWSDQILCVRTPADFAAGDVRVTLYSCGKFLASSKLQYYTRIEELNSLLSSVADPVEFMFQVNPLIFLKTFIHVLPPTLFTLKTNTHAQVHHGDVPSLLHFAARYGFRSVSGLLLQCPGAERALRMTNRHGQTPAEIAKSHGHTELHTMLKETLVTPSTLGSPFFHFETLHFPKTEFPTSKKCIFHLSDQDVMVHETFCGLETLSIVVLGKQGQPDGEDEDLYAPLGVNEDSNSNLNSEKAVILANRPPAPTPRPESMQLKESRTSYIAQAQRQEDSVSGTYDTFIPNQKQLEQLMELQQRIKSSSLSVAKALNHLSDQQQQVKKGPANNQEVGCFYTHRRGRCNGSKSIFVEPQIYCSLKKGLGNL
uniref:DBB domain-containing protein n=1 Tax=Cyprinodon variegatus TaxID=28743 RepID=A0A3Q2E8K0_CYPVA